VLQVYLPYNYYSQKVVLVHCAKKGGALNSFLKKVVVPYKIVAHFILYLQSSHLDTWKRSKLVNTTATIVVVPGI